jgi:hypothetical protein
MAKTHPEHDAEKGITALNAARNEPLPEGTTKKERLDRLVSALGGYVDDEPAQLGQSDETVWDVSCNRGTSKFKLNLLGPACSPAPAPRSVPESDPLDILPPEAKRPSHRPAYHQTLVLDRPARRSSRATTLIVSWRVHGFRDFQGRPHGSTGAEDPGQPSQAILRLSYDPSTGLDRPPLAQTRKEHVQILGR